eukprot:TRINITY_DN51543_c0_g1_i1.p1 TRINITY_DN51543_c0_g1~~TRINITY_DN51543_c0_g1_i1.p1  ORF type:complete len:363 (+),score=99.71 TRINITY_DN51543_c0_g1_i1:115-1203(+)
MAFVLKVSHEGDVRRKRYSSVSDVTFEDIDAMIAESFGLHEHTIKYKDDEGDLCTLSKQTLQDALELSLTSAVLRLEVTAIQTDDASEAASEGGAPSLSSWEAVEFEDDKDLSSDIEDAASDIDMEKDEVKDLEASEEHSHQGTSDASDAPKDIVPTPEDVPVEQLVEDPESQATPPEVSLQDEDTIMTAESTPVPVQSPATADDETDPENRYANAKETFSATEKVQVVLAAFDVNGDGRLDFEESNELQKFAHGEHIPLEVYQALCAELEEEAAMGLGAEALARLYERYGTLDRDFEAALRKVASSEAGPRLADEHAWGAGRPSRSGSQGPSPLLGLALMPICPIAGAIALGATISQRVRS